MRILLPIDDSLVERVDAASGKQPRVSWIRDAIEEKLGRTSEPTESELAPTSKYAEMTPDQLIRQIKR